MSHTPADPTAGLRPIRETFGPMSISRRIAQVLRTQLGEGAFDPGQRLNEIELSEAFQVSRNTVREAIVELASERLVVRSVNRGVFVATFDEGDVRDLYALRRVLEVESARSGSHMAAIREIREATTTAKTGLAEGNEAVLGTANTNFHRSIVKLAGSDRLNTTMDHVMAEMRLLFISAALGGKYHADWVEPNEMVLKAIESGRREEAAKLLTRYMDQAEAELIRRLRIKSESRVNPRRARS